ncbi:hypothetical protein BDW02DRAFT_591533 [Decorospora gaudefroyi]|uniref:Uncharacterized protein n=1 Tax=Decorospora gaudefroyi TaxID=184978 RepID=A0A6A5K468_9PLEO|nr:hypothetical protein BDW02DRAFT_591533 [Decorospora gaudefroyi]
MSNWFGDLQLAYKYIVVFLSLLVLAILAGFVKVFFDRRKLKKAKQAELEAGPSQDTVELNQREKDEGDLFGIRAIEAGFYAGVAQSRPTSRRGSVIDHPSMSNSTLVGGSASSPLMKAHSNNNSVLSLNLNATKDNGTRRASPPAMKLAPSEAELSGRRNHNGAVDMSLQVPASPRLPRGPPSPTFGGSDDGSDGFTSPRSMSPRSADFKPEHYAPAPTVPMPDALKVSYHVGDESGPKSQAASFNTSPSASPTPSPHSPPTARLPTIPGSALRKESRSPSPEDNYPRVQVHQANSEPAQLSSSESQIRLQPRTYSPSHQRDGSDASSIYSGGDRLSTFQTYHAYHKDANKKAAHPSLSTASKTSTESRNYDFASANEPSRASVMAPQVKDGEQRPSLSNNHLAPAQATNKDTRLSEFYEAYYRNSHIGPAQPVDAKRPLDRKSTIEEVDSPMPSPLFPKTQQPGAAY